MQSQVAIERLKMANQEGEYFFPGKLFPVISGGV
jgi:hypothetical protein